MIALDTNVLVRILTRDDEDQAVRAAALVSEHRVFIPLTVVLETEWVLRSTYGFDRSAIANAFLTMLGISTFQIADRAVVWRALQLYQAGSDFADALHLSSAPRGASFATFDRTLQRKAARFAEVTDVFEPT